MNNVPILKIENFILVSIQTELHDHTAELLQKDLLAALDEGGARGVLIDVTALDLVDSFLGRLLGDTAKMTRIMGAPTVLAGLRPAVAITMVELGINLAGVHTTLNIDTGLAWLRQQEGAPGE